MDYQILSDKLNENITAYHIKIKEKQEHKGTLISQPLPNSEMWKED